MSLLPALAVAAVSLGAAASTLRPAPARGELAVVFAPWVSEANAYRLVLEAGGRVVGPSRFGNIAIAFAPDTGFADRVRRVGGWLTLAAEGLCGPLLSTSRDPES